MRGSMDPSQFALLISKLDSLIEVLSDPWAVVAAIAGAVSALASARSAYFAERAATEVRDRELLPIIVPTSEGHLSVQTNNSMRLHLHNVGRGVAKEIYVHIENVLVGGNYSLESGGEGLSLNIPADDTSSSVLRPILAKRQPQLKMKIGYRDVFDKEHRTLAKLNLQGDHYLIDRGQWKFE